VDYLVRQARITDVDRLYALCVEMGAAPGAGTPLDAIGLLRQLVYMPNASVVVAEGGRQIAGGAVVGLRPSVRAGGFVGTVDVLVVAPGHSVEKVADELIVEIMTSARRKGCSAVEVMLPDDANLRACWIRHGFSLDQANIYRAEVPGRAPASR
jgi:predicted N-acetyltransferase YhbS